MSTVPTPADAVATCVADSFADSQAAPDAEGTFWGARANTALADSAVDAASSVAPAADRSLMDAASAVTKLRAWSGNRYFAAHPGRHFGRTSCGRPCHQDDGLHFSETLSTGRFVVAPSAPAAGDCPVLVGSVITLGSR